MSRSNGAQSLLSEIKNLKSQSPESTREAEKLMKAIPEKEDKKAAAGAATGTEKAVGEKAAAKTKRKKAPVVETVEAVQFTTVRIDRSFNKKLAMVKTLKGKSTIQGLMEEMLDSYLSLKENASLKDIMKNI